MSQGGQRTCEDDDVPILGDTDQKAWIRSARLVSYASITFTLVGGILGIVLSVITDRSVILLRPSEGFMFVFSVSHSWDTVWNLLSMSGAPCLFCGVSGVRIRTVRRNRWLLIRESNERRSELH